MSWIPAISAAPRPVFTFAQILALQERDRGIHFKPNRGWHISAGYSIWDLHPFAYCPGSWKQELLLAKAAVKP